MSNALEVMTMPKLSSRQWEDGNPSPEFFRIEREAAFALVLRELKARRDLTNTVIDALQNIQRWEPSK